MTFTESNTVEQMIPDAAAKLGGKLVSMVREDAPPYKPMVLGYSKPMGSRWLHCSGHAHPPSW